MPTASVSVFLKLFILWNNVTRLQYNPKLVWLLRKFWKFSHIINFYCCDWNSSHITWIDHNQQISNRIKSNQIKSNHIIDNVSSYQVWFDSKVFLANESPPFHIEYFGVLTRYYGLRKFARNFAKFRKFFGFCFCYLCFSLFFFAGTVYVYWNLIGLIMYF